MQEFYFALLGDEVNFPLYVSGVGSTDPERHCLRPAGHPLCQIIYTASGEGVLKIDGKEYPIPRNAGFYLPANYPHEYLPKDGMTWETRWVSFSGKLCDSILDNLGLSKPVIFQTQDLSGLDRAWEKMLNTIHSTKFYSGHQNSALLYAFLIEVNKAITCPASPKENYRLEQVKRVIEYIDEHYKENITLGDMAKVVNLSPQYICRLFRETVGERPFEHLAKKRVQEAKILLVNTRSSITKISKTLGFSDSSYFCSVFKKYEGITPVDYRQRYAPQKSNNSQDDYVPYSF